ncbi:MAG: GLUG motif-containing protein, partial [Xanthobacteraceae bacterium]
ENGEYGGFNGFAPDTTFTGTFDGSGGLGQNYTISGLTSSLFPIIGAGGIVRNLNLTDVNIISEGSGRFGALAGLNEGTISGVSVSGSIITYGAGVIAGGLVGENRGLITQSTASVLVSVGDGTTGPNGGFNYAGGLVGINTGTISQSSAGGFVPTIGGSTAVVEGGLNSFVGGLVGQNGTGQPGGGGVIESSSAFADAFGLGSVGGLVGFNAAGATITGSQVVDALVLTTGSGFAGGLVGQNDGLIVSSSATGLVAGFGGAILGLVDSSSSLASSSLARPTFTLGQPGQYVSIGGLVGVNHGTVQDSSASASVFGLFANAGGLVGYNSGSIIGTSPGQVRAEGTVMVDGDHSTGGGLVGFNAAGGTIHNAAATGEVTAGLFFAGLDPSFAVGPQFTNTGGLVGQNAGSIDHSIAAVTVQGGFGSAGGLVGQNDGLISTSSASGAVSGSGFAGALASLGGLVGTNQGTVQDSSAAATVVGSFAYAGGLVGFNSGTITGTNPGQVRADGTVTVDGAHSAGGGLVGFNAAGGTIHNAGVTGTVAIGLFGTSTDVLNLGGLVGQNAGSIDHSVAAVTVQGGFGSAGGLVGQNDGLISTSSASGAVSGSGFAGALASLGGLVGTNQGTVQDSSAAATVVGSFAYAGGLVGFNSGTITGTNPGQVRVDGTVMVDGDHSTAGGLVGFNALGGIIHNSGASGSVAIGLFGTSTDVLNLGGLVGQNAGSIDHSVAAVTVQGGLGSAGGLVGLNDGVISASSASGLVSGSGFDGRFVMLGGLVGNNNAGGQITDSSASGAVALGTFGNAGGLVGFNRGFIANSSASGAVTSDGLFTAIGGLVGYNSVGAHISNSQASGSVTSLANASSETETTDAGGLVGINYGILTNTGASGAVSVGAHGNGGGLVGFNGGTIATSFATGAVTGAAGLPDSGPDNGHHTHLGGLAGTNQGTITDSGASGEVGSAGVAFLTAGGLVGDNSGTILRSFALGNVRVGDHGTAGGLVGDNGASDCQGCIIGDGHSNEARIADSHAGGSVTGGAGSLLGGLAASNSGSLTNTFATGAVSGGNDSVIGGLVGVVDVGATITNSQAHGSVSGLGIHSVVGGLVGVSFGTIAGSTAAGAVTAASQSYAGGLVGINLGNVQQSLALSSVSVTGTGTRSILGGLVGMNAGTINLSASSASVIGGSLSSVGGLVGANVALLGIPPGLTLNGSSFPVGTITQSLAFGAVSGGPGSHVGGLIGDNGGSISGLTASQSVIGGENSVVGGLVGRNGGLTSIPGLPSIFATCTQAACIALQNASVSSAPGSIAKSQATGNVTGGVGSVVGGLVGENPGLISESTASGIVGGGEGSSVGGLVGRNVHGRITLAAATSTVIGGHGSMVGGLVGLNLAGLIQDSFASGSVSGGDGSIAGGLVAANLGTVSRSFANGAVTGGDDSHVGGLVGVNYAIPGFSGEVASGTISQSYATGAATGGAGSTVGGLVADNGGTVDQTYATGLVTGGPGSTTGGLIAVNSATFVVPDGLLSDGGGPASVTAALGGPTETGTVTFSYWDKQTTGQASSDGGTGLTTAQFNSGLPAGFDPAVWGVLPGESYPFLHGQPVGTIQPVGPLPPPPPDVTPLPPLQEVLLPPPPQQQVVEVRQTDPQPTGEVVSTQSPPTTGSTSRPSDQASGRGPLRPDGRPSNVPPIGETRFINNEVVFQICSDVPAQRIQSTMRRLRLDLLSSQSLGLIGCTVYHSRITNGRSVRDIIIALERDRLIDEVTPNYTFALAQDASAPAPAAAGEAAQYAVAKLRLAEAHQLAKGDDVLIAVIDSEIDAKHPDLEGAIAARYDAVGPADKPHPHGTGMAGAIASHRKLIGTAPGARLLAIRAFGTGSGGAQGTTVQIVKGIDWAISQGAKIVNMSFAGPKDPTLQKAFKAALDKSVVLIAAAGNAGPKSPPLYPGADPSVIAVSATDADDQVYTNANRGKYVAVAAPGVDILVLAPEGNYELTTGTSVASAEVSGVAALLLQRDPKMDPATVREILTSTANLLGAKGRTDELGYGLVDAYKALLSVNAKSASAPGAVAATSRN